MPVYLYEVRHLNSKTMAAYEQNLKKSTKAAGQGAKDGQTAPPKLLRLFALYEHLICFVMPLCTAIPNRPNPETPVTQSCNIVDISGVGLRQFWNLRSHMQDASTLATAHYPETLDRIFVRGPSKVCEATDRPLDHRCAILLPDRVVMDQELVRPHYRVKDLHPLRS